jgi:hypothetical protein
MRGGFVCVEPNKGLPINSRKVPGLEVTLHQYPESIWLWERYEGSRWRPARPPATEEIAVFARRGKLR